MFSNSYKHKEPSPVFLEGSLIAKADIQQISVNGFDGIDFGKEAVVGVSAGIGPFEFEAKAGEYHSDLCSYYEQGDHDTSLCPNTIHYNGRTVDTGFSIGIEVYIIHGLTLEIGYDYPRVIQRWIEIWEE